MLRFLYQTCFGRIILKVLTRPQISIICGRFLDSKYSRLLVPYFVKKNKITLSEFQDTDFENFNQCFCRKIRPEYRPIDMQKGSFISPCDGLLSAYRIQGDLVIPVKQSAYHISDLLRDEKLAEKYQGGTCLVIRLCVNHYHRYCYPDNGIKTGNVFLPGVLHTVRPIALRQIPVFTENSREYTCIQTENFGEIVQMEVGAMLVGKIHNLHGEGRVEKGQEKGYFLYGGSTIILLLEPERVKFPEKLYQYTREQKEVPVRYGQKIGIKKKQM